MKELLLNPSKVVTKTRLLDLMSIDSENCDESSLKVHISNIRKKIRKNTQEEYIEAIWGIGYKIKEIKTLPKLYFFLNCFLYYFLLQ